MALIVNKQNTEYEYTPQSERGEKKPFTIKFRTLTIRELALLEDNFITLKGADSFSLSQGTYNYRAVKTAMTGWSNLIDGDGKALKLEKSGKDEVLDSSLEYLPALILNEIASVIIGVSKDPSDAQTILG